MKIYEPSDDSYLFSDFLKKYLENHKINSYLDIGTGSGILPKTALNFIPPKNITASDINPEAIKSLKKESFNTIKSDLFENINKKFDLITFNAPYLPLDPLEPYDSRLATTGGKRGDEISLKFLKEAKSHLNQKGKIFLLISSLTPTNKIKKLWPYKVVESKKIFMEELLILEFKLRTNNL
jgi:release factor glutamine methyltransferase